MVLQERIELSASPLPRECSTTELLQHLCRRRRRKRPASAIGAVLLQDACEHCPSDATTMKRDRPKRRHLMCMADGRCKIVRATALIRISGDLLRRREKRY